MKRFPRLALVLLAAMLVPGAALAKKKKDEPVAPVEVVVEPNTPTDGASKKFAKHLVAAQIANFKPSDAGGATFLYASLRFNPDNTWVAEAFVEMGGERMDCTESGAWTMEPAESDSVGMVAWSLDKTNCPGRESGATTRAKLTFDGDKLTETTFR